MDGIKKIVENQPNKLSKFNYIRLKVSLSLYQLDYLDLTKCENYIS